MDNTIRSSISSSGLHQRFKDNLHSFHLKLSSHALQERFLRPFKAHHKSHHGKSDTEGITFFSLPTEVKTIILKHCVDAEPRTWGRLRRVDCHCRNIIDALPGHSEISRITLLQLYQSLPRRDPMSQNVPLSSPRSTLPRTKDLHVYKNSRLSAPSDVYPQDNHTYDKIHLDPTVFNGLFKGIRSRSTRAMHRASPICDSLVSLDFISLSYHVDAESKAHIKEINERWFQFSYSEAIVSVSEGTVLRLIGMPKKLTVVDSHPSLIPTFLKVRGDTLRDANMAKATRRLIRKTKRDQVSRLWQAEEFQDAISAVCRILATGATSVLWGHMTAFRFPDGRLRRAQRTVITIEDEEQR